MAGVIPTQSFRNGCLYIAEEAATGRRDTLQSDIYARRGLNRDEAGFTSVDVPGHVSRKAHKRLSSV